MGFLGDAWDFVKRGGVAAGSGVEDASPEEEAQHARDMAAADARNAERDRIVAGGNQKELAEWNDANWGDESNRKGRSNFLSPGATDVGGYRGGAKDIHDFFRAGEKNNDAAQQQNSAAMGLSLERMRQDRAPIAENATLVAREAASRGQQLQATGLMGQAAMGNAPSAANQQTTMALNDGMAGQAGAAGAARGLSALNGVQGGASGVGMQATNTMMNGGMARSKEVDDAMGQYGGMAGDVRSGDLGRVTQTNQNALAGQSLNDDWKLGNAGLAAKQGQLGNGMGQIDDSYYGASQDPAKRQLGYDQEMKSIEAGASMDSAAAKRAKTNAEQDRNRAMASGAAQAGLSLVGGPVAGSLGGGMANSAIRSVR